MRLASSLLRARCSGLRLDFAATTALLALALLACGGKNNADPRLIPGGGVGDGAISGRVNVYVVEAYSDDAIANAEVKVGEPGETPLTGTTDSSGLYSFEDDLEGPQTITVIADGYVVTTWFGANGANVTIPLDPSGTPAVAKARLEGTIAGWADLPDPATDHLLLASIECSDTTRLGDPQNQLEQPNIGGLPGNICIKASAGSRCEWALNARVGTVALHATLLDVDTKGTLEDTDDSHEIIGYAFHLGTVVEAGVDQTGITLARAEPTSLTDVTVTVADLPGGLDESALILGLELADQGILMLGLAQNPGTQIELPVPSLSGDFAEATYRATTYAGQSGVANGDGSAILQRDITNLAQTIALGDWLAMATDLAVAGGTYSFTPVAGTPLHTVTFHDGTTPLWDIAILDERTSFTLPGITPNPIPATTVDMEVSQFATGDIDLSDFSINDFWDVLRRTSTTRRSLTL